MTEDNRLPWKEVKEMAIDFAQGKKSTFLVEVKNDNPFKEQILALAEYNEQKYRLGSLSTVCRAHKKNLKYQSIFTQVHRLLLEAQKLSPEYDNCYCKDTCSSCLGYLFPNSSNGCQYALLEKAIKALETEIKAFHPNLEE